MEKTHHRGIVRGDDGTPLVSWSAEYPTGISPASDSCYSEAAAAFEHSCTNSLRELAQYDYDCDTDPRKKYRRRAWIARFIANTDSCDTNTTTVTLTVSICAGKRSLLFKQFTDSWNTNEPVNSMIN